jgi:hypothetical protein
LAATHNSKKTILLLLTSSRYDNNLLFASRYQCEFHSNRKVLFRIAYIDALEVVGEELAAESLQNNMG